METRQRRLYLLLLLNFFFFGISLTIIGASLPKIINDYTWSYIESGIVLAAGSIGYFVSTFVSGFLIRAWGFRPVLVLGLALSAVSCFFFGIIPFFLFNTILNFMIGAGQGGLEVVVNSAVVRMERKGEQHLMGYVHAAFSAGAVLGPLGVGSFLASGAGWRGGFAVLGAAFGILAVSAVFYPFSRLRSTDSNGGEEKGAVRYPWLVALGTAVILVYVGIEVGVSNWIGEFSLNKFALSPEKASLWVALFWGGMLAGRTLFPLLLKRMRPGAELLLLTGVAAAASAGAGLAGSAVLGAVLTVLAGAGCSSIYPLVMLIVGRRLRGNESVGLGIVSTGGGVGGFVFPFIMSALSEVFGIKQGFLFFPGIGILLVLLSFVLMRRDRTL
jgi:fucose permease